MNAAASGELLAVADMLDGFADLQNGPDNLVLRWGDTVVDAVGYGGFGGNDSFRGEGRAVASPPPGLALARIGDLQDTDDNRDDFAIVPVPTPGGPFVSARRPGAFGDLVVTEVMADPKVQSDNAGEWIELANPSADVTWDSAGCQLVSEPAEVHTIQGALLVPPGGRVALARGGDPAGFVPDYVYGGITLTNDLDLVGLVCDDVLIDDFAWIHTAPVARA